MTSSWKFTSEIEGGFQIMTNDDERGEGGKKCPKFDDVICERPIKARSELGWWQNFLSRQRKVAMNKRHQVEPTVSDSEALRYPSVAET